MPITPERIAAVRNFDDLLTLLSEELDWRLPEGAALEDSSFDWDADELRLSEASAKRLGGGLIRQLRPLRQGQPWGIFFVEFAEAQIYRTALRQILRALVPNRRKNASLQSWKHDNLLFICATSDYQRITFAHFHGDSVDKAKLSTFGWTSGSAYLRTLISITCRRCGGPKMMERILSRGPHSGRKLSIRSRSPRSSSSGLTLL